MPFVNKTDDDGERSNLETTEGPPTFDEIDFDPSDPDTVKVHYDLSAWGIDQRAELSETFAEQGVPHVWQGDEVLVPEQIEPEIDAIFEILESELGPFPVSLDPDSGGTEFGLDEWPASSLDMLREALTEAEIPHRWEGSTVIVADDAETVVDGFLDAIESGGISSPSEEEAPEGALNALYSIGHELEREPTDSKPRVELIELALTLSADAPPFGMAVGQWRIILAEAQALVDLFESGEAENVSIAEHAGALKAACRPWV